MTFQSLLSVVVLAPLFGCAAVAPRVPLSTQQDPAEVTLVWVGRGECERLENGQWVRIPEFDYDFSVEQRRMANHWESVKSMRRRHPGYDGSAGERAQTYFFRMDYAPAGSDPSASVTSQVHSSLGNGQGTTDREFRRAQIEFAAAGESSLAPFDRYRITQTYDYEAGQLTELVELNKGAQAWVRNREQATLFGARRFDAAPTRAH